MSATFQLILRLVERNEVRVSLHGYDELAQDKIRVRDVIEGIKQGEPIEDYPEYTKGPCVLVFQKDKKNHPIHVVWGIPRNATSPAVLVTAYRPSGEKWSSDFRRRKK